MRRIPIAALIALSVLMGACGHQENGPVAELKDVYESARALEGGLTVGVTYGDYGSLVREMSKAIVIAHDRLKFAQTPAEPGIVRALEKYTEVLEMYKDAGGVWQLQVQEKKYADELPRIAAKYGVAGAVQDRTEHSYGVTLHPRYVDYDAIKQAIWAKATQAQGDLVAAVYRVTVPPQVKK